MQSQSQKTSSSIKTSPQPSILLNNKSSIFTTTTNANSFSASTPISNNTGDDDNIDLKYSTTYNQTNYLFPSYDYTNSNSFQTSNTYQQATIDSTTQFNYPFQPINNNQLTSESYAYPYSQIDYWPYNYSAHYSQISTSQQKLSPELHDISNNTKCLGSVNYANFDSSISPTATYPKIQYQQTSPISAKQQFKTNNSIIQEVQQTSTPIISSNSSSLSCASSVSSLSTSKEQVINISPKQQTNSSISTTTTINGTTQSTFDWMKSTTKPANGKLHNSIIPKGVIKYTYKTIIYKS